MNREIDYVLEVAKSGSILKASERLYITSSALSKYIQTLEKRYNIKLFDRVGKKFVLTYAGKRYLHWIIRQQKLLKEMENELADISNSLQGIVKVGIPVGFSEYWIKNTLKRFNDKYPQIKIQLIEDISTRIIQMLVSNDLDFAITELITDETGVIYTKLYEETIAVVASKDNVRFKKLAKKRREHKYPWISLQECQGYNFVVPLPDQNITKNMNKIFADNDIEVNPIVTTRNITAIIDCVSADLGITITTDFAVFLSHSQDELRIYSFGEEPLTRQWSIVHNKDHYLAEHVKALMDMTIHDYEILSEQMS